MRRGLYTFASVCLLSLAMITTGCDSTDEDELAVVDIAPTSAPNSTVQGTLEFEETGDGIRIFGTVTGLTPGDHGMHFHVNGTCADADLPEDPDTLADPAGAAGPHFDPLATMNHAGPDTTFSERHAGDTGNITADSSGTATIDAEYDGLSIAGTYGIVGRTLIVHANPDDLTTDPGGGSGTRMGCGVVRSQ